MSMEGYLENWGGWLKIHKNLIRKKKIELIFNNQV
jgi:hypothetical protein